MWIVKLLTEPSAIQAVIVLSAVCALGLSLAKFRFRGVSLGITFVFFAGILAGALGLKLDPQMVAYAESFGLILFVYTLGLQVGPGFVTTFKHGGTWLNILSLTVVIIALCFVYPFVNIAYISKLFDVYFAYWFQVAPDSNHIVFLHINKGPLAVTEIEHYGTIVLFDNGSHALKPVYNYLIKLMQLAPHAPVVGNT